MFSCKKNADVPANIETTAISSSKNCYSTTIKVQNTDLKTTCFSLEDLAENKDDSQDDQISKKLVKLTKSFSQVINNSNNVKIILELVQNSSKDEISIKEILDSSPQISNMVETNLLAQGTSIEEVITMKYDNVDYFPTIHIPNLSILDAQQKPILSVGSDVDMGDDIEDDFIPAILNAGTTEEQNILVDENASKSLTNPLFIFTQNTTKVETFYLSDEVQPKPQNFVYGTQYRTAQNFVYATQYRIAHRYDVSRFSDYYGLACAIFSNSSPNTLAWDKLNRIDKIHRRDVPNRTFNNTRPIQYGHGLQQLPLFVANLTYEYDWWAGRKQININVGVNAIFFPRMKYAHEWYQQLVVRQNSFNDITQKGFLRVSF